MGRGVGGADGRGRCWQTRGGGRSGDGRSGGGEEGANGDCRGCRGNGYSTFPSNAAHSFFQSHLLHTPSRTPTPSPRPRAPHPPPRPTPHTDTHPQRLSQVSDRHLPIALNAVCPLRRARFPNHILQALTHSTLRALTCRGVPTTLDPPATLTYNTRAYHEHISGRWRSLQRVINAGINVIFTGADVLLLRSPLALLPPSVDVAVRSDASLVHNDAAALGLSRAVCVSATSRGGACGCCSASCWWWWWWCCGWWSV